MKLVGVLIIALLNFGCIGDRYVPILGPKTSQVPSVFERLPGEINLFNQGGNTVEIYGKCLELSAHGNGDASYAAAIIVGQGHIAKFQTIEEKEAEMMRLMYKAQYQGSVEATEFVKSYEQVGIQKW